jgi:hypothetical protein
MCERARMLLCCGARREIMHLSRERETASAQSARARLCYVVRRDKPFQQEGVRGRFTLAVDSGLSKEGHSPVVAWYE